ncbi:Zinc knuckle [Carex littledalei]|uniref:Zinc knuckle n=1 Tax=Carex littledalei TaxID=544730 RepID=A0A833VRX2_9POAL|nr:Zinc knuckle [Carex littledalei]
MASLSARLAEKQAILQRIEARRAAATTPTYAEIVALGRTEGVSPRKPNLLHPPFQQPQDLFRPITTTCNCINEAHIDGGWTKVTRKRRTRAPEKERKPVTLLNKRILTLKAEGRCFKCLDRGHTQFNCRNGVKCHNCHGIGHISKICTAARKKHINLQGTEPQHLKNRTTEQPTEQPTAKEMDLETWETAPMLSPNLIGIRAPKLRVFFPPNDNLRSSNALLHRSVVVLIGPRAAAVPDLHGRIATAVATTFGCHPAEFKVETLEPSAGDLIVEFPSNILRNLAVHVGVFTIARGIDVQLRAWSPNLNMVRDPTTHQARITLHGVPTQYWNFPDINHLISGFGYAVSMSPVITNGNYETLRVLVACYDPSTIPPSISVHKNPFSKVAYIHIEGWVHIPPPSPPPPTFPDEDDQGSSNLGPLRTAHRHRTPTNRSAAGYNNHPMRHGMRRAPNPRAGRDYAGRNGDIPCDNPKTRPINPMETPVLHPTLNPVTRVSIEEGDHQKENPNPSFTPALPQIFSSEHAIAVNSYRKWRTAFFSLIWHLPPIQQQKKGLSITEFGDSGQQPCGDTCHSFINKEDSANTLESIAEEKEKSGACYAAQEEMSLHTTSPIHDIIQTGPPSHAMPASPLAITQGLHLLTLAATANHETPQLIEEGPPGFEGPPKYKQKKIVTRRSSRLQNRNQGHYISAIDQARATQGFITVPKLMQRPKAKPKTIPKPPMEYLATYNPLSQAHAEAVVAAASAELDGDLRRKIEEATRDLSQEVAIVAVT